MTPDKQKYEIEEVQQVGPHLVMKVKYPNCSSCAYEGNKVMVFLNCSPLDAMRWREIDPHFRAPVKSPGAPTSHSITEAKKKAPSPAARFPASAEGWTDAITYANGKLPARTA
jgi:hypothetical protein